MADLQTSPPTPKVNSPKAPDASKGMTLFVMIVATLYFGREVLVPVTLALLLAFILAPLVDVLRRCYLGRVPSVLLGVLVSLSIISAIGGVIGSQIGDLSTDLPNYVSTVETKIATFRHYTVGQLSKVANSIGVQHKDGSSALVSAIPALQAPSAQSSSAAPGQQATQSTSPVALAQRYLSPILAPLANIGIVFVVAVFALLQREDLRDRLIRLIGSDDLHRTTLAIDEAARRLSKYFVTQLSINTVFGVVIGTGLLIVGVPNPVLWGILSGLLRFVPYVGSFISALLPLALAAAVEPGWSMMLWTAALYAVAEGLTGQIIEPLVYGHSTGLSPFSVVVAAIFWSWLWGPIGLILSTPLTLCVVVMGRHIKKLEFLDVMLGDGAPLTSVESFYQRILAGDADEVQDQAERILKQCTLANYYDEVAVKGLQLAANDALRGALDAEQLERIRNTVKSLVRGLDRLTDKLSPSSKSDDATATGEGVSASSVPLNMVAAQDQSDHSSTMLCIAGRGSLDDAAAAMLAQLLAKQGVTTRLVAYTDVARDQIEQLDTTGISMICVCYLDIHGNPAHLRYLMQRLKQKFPSGVPILIGMWPANDATLTDAATKAAIGADYYVSSLEQTLSVYAETQKDKKVAA